MLDLPRRRNRWFALGVGAGVVVPAALVLVFSFVGGGQLSLEDQRSAFATYDKAVERAVQDGGFIVTRGMRPGVGEIAQGVSPDAALVRMARGWTASMEDVRADLAEVSAPEFLLPTARAFDAALSGYVEVGRALLLAAKAPKGAERDALIREVPPLGERADALWEKARGLMERERTRLKAKR